MVSLLSETEKLLETAFLWTAVAIEHVDVLNQEERTLLVLDLRKTGNGDFAEYLRVRWGLPEE